MCSIERSGPLPAPCSLVSCSPAIDTNYENGSWSSEDCANFREDSGIRIGYNAIMRLVFLLTFLGCLNDGGCGLVWWSALACGIVME